MVGENIVCAVALTAAFRGGNGRCMRRNNHGRRVSEVACTVAATVNCPRAHRRARHAVCIATRCPRGRGREGGREGGRESERESKREGGRERER